MMNKEEFGQQKYTFPVCWPCVCRCVNVLVYLSLTCWLVSRKVANSDPHSCGSRVQDEWTHTHTHLCRLADCMEFSVITANGCLRGTVFCFTWQMVGHSAASGNRDNHLPPLQLASGPWLLMEINGQHSVCSKQEPPILSKVGDSGFLSGHHSYCYLMQAADRERPRWRPTASTPALELFNCAQLMYL